MDILQLRVIERVLAVAIGGLSIYLGYRLFVRMPNLPRGEAKASLPGGVSIALSRIGPGVVFSGFGIVVVALSLYRGLTISESAELRQVAATGADSARADSAPLGRSRATRVINYLGPSVDGVDSAQRARRREDARRTVEDLDALRALVKHAAPDQQGDMERAIRDAKVATLGMVWDGDWGDFATFHNWVVDMRESEPVPPGVEASAIRAFRARRD